MDVLYFLKDRTRLIRQYYGDMEGCRGVVALAVENHPGHPALLEFETNLQLTAPIIWRNIMLPAAEQPQQKNADS